MLRTPVRRATVPRRAPRQARPAGKPIPLQVPGSAAYLELLRLRLRLLLAERPHACIRVLVSPETAGSLVRSIEFLIGEGARYILVAPDMSAAWSREAAAVLEQQSKLLAQRYMAWSDDDAKYRPEPFDGSP